MRKTICTTAIMFICAASLYAAGTDPVRVCRAERAAPNPPRIDGHLTDPAWQSAQWQKNFVQHSPNEGEEPSQKTAFKILYDDKNVYVAVRAYDTEPEKIDRRILRRDNVDGDHVSIAFDSFYDHQTAFEFTVNAGGVQSDAIISSNGESTDRSLDMVWHVKTRVDDQGWSAEYAIPLNQLRFANRENQVWGLEVKRQIYRKNETSLWQPIPQDAPGFVHLFGELRGIKNIKNSKRIEVLPYSLAKGTSEKRDPGNPFRTGRNASANIGLDAKIGVTSDLTLDVTMNPDFGQVEADPSVVNLSAYETYYQEKRPFFVEGNNILSFKLMIGDGDLSNANLFYSRRIGRSCSYTPDINDNEYLRMPGTSSILGAAKMTGKTKSGLSIGIMDAVTSREFGQINNMGTQRDMAVEPMANYFVSRVKKDYNEGATTIGGMLTNTYRHITDPHLEFLNRKATTGGVDINHTWKNRTYTLQFTGIFSHISGSTDAITEAQTASARYFQRPDAGYVTLDSSRTSMGGHGGTLLFGKMGNSHIKYLTCVSWRSPGLELNDVGYMRNADNIFQANWAQYRIWDPFFLFNSFSMNVNQWNIFNFGRELTSVGGNVNFHFNFRNEWGFHMGINRNGRELSASALRGGPSLLLPGSWYTWIAANTDHRKPFQLEVNGSYSNADDGISFSRSIRAGLRWRANDRCSVNAIQYFGVNRDAHQYIDTIELDSENRYIMGCIDQKTMVTVLRLDVCITPNLTIQFYGQPFVSSGSFSSIKRMTDTRAGNIHDRSHIFESDEIVYNTVDEQYCIDENGDGRTDYTFEKPDFNFRQFRSNLVIRWEYAPRSTIFLVWSQDRTGLEDIGRFNYSSDMRGLFNVYPTNIIMLKINKWFSI